MRSRRDEGFNRELAAVYRVLEKRERHIRERIFRECPCWLVNEVSDPTQRRVPCGEVRRWRRQDAIFAIRHQGRDHFPMFQFEVGKPKPAIGRLLRLIRPDDGWYAMFWFHAANSWLEGRAPLDLMDTDLEAVVEAACHARDAISD